MTFVEPKIKVIKVEQENEVTRVTLLFDKLSTGVTEPLAPAGLYVDPNSGQEQFQLHKFIDKKERIFRFETFHSSHPVPKVGETYYYRGWWLPEAMTAALDETVLWEKKKYPNNGNHSPCLFTWDNIAAYAEHKEGYVSKYGWITEEAYQKIIQEDFYRIRIKKNNP